MGVKVLLSGGAGFIGSWVAEALLRAGHEVAVFDNLATGNRANLSRVMKDIQLYEGDVRDASLVDQAASECDAVVHLAAVSNVVDCTNNPRFALSTNVEGTLTLLEAARWNSYRRFVFASSAAVYGEPRALPVPETASPSPMSVYAATKLAGEALVDAYASSFGLSGVCLRLFNVYGPRQRAGDYAGVITKFFDDAKRKGTLTIEGTGRQTRDLVFVEDAARAVVKALGSRAGGHYNIGSGGETSVSKLAAWVKRHASRRLDVVRAEGRVGDISRSCADVRLAKRYLRWEPTVDIEKGLERTFEWYSSAERGAARRPA